MTKSELMEALAESRGISRRTAEEVVNVLFDGMRDALKNDGRIEIRGFGYFCALRGLRTKKKISDLKKNKNFLEAAGTTLAFELV